MGVYSTKPKWQQWLQPIVDFSVRAKIHPDYYIYGAIVLAGIAGYGLMQADENLAWLWAVAACALLRLGFNLMDGLVAREMGIADAWGEVMNEFGDRISDGIIFLGLAFSGYVDIRWMLVALVLISYVSYLGILGKAVGGNRLYNGIFGKGDRMISLSIFCFYILYSKNLEDFNYYLILGVVAAVITIIQRLRKAYELRTLVT